MKFINSLLFEKERVGGFVGLMATLVLSLSAFATLAGLVTYFVNSSGNISKTKLNYEMLDIMQELAHSVIEQGMNRRRSVCTYSTSTSTTTTTLPAQTYKRYITTTGIKNTGTTSGTDCDKIEPGDDVELYFHNDIHQASELGCVEHKNTKYCAQFYLVPTATTTTNTTTSTNTPTSSTTTSTNVIGIGIIDKDSYCISNPKSPKCRNCSDDNRCIDIVICENNPSTRTTDPSDDPCGGKEHYRQMVMIIDNKTDYVTCDDYSSSEYYSPSSDEVCSSTSQLKLKAESDGIDTPNVTCLERISISSIPTTTDQKQVIVDDFCFVTPTTSPVCNTCSDCEDENIDGNTGERTCTLQTCGDIDCDGDGSPEGWLNKNDQRLTSNPSCYKQITCQKCDKACNTIPCYKLKQNPPAGCPSS